MDAAARRRLIAARSPFSPPDTRHRCEECDKVLDRRDFLSYWDGCPDLEREHAVPRCCEDCAEGMELKSV